MRLRFASIRRFLRSHRLARRLCWLALLMLPSLAADAPLPQGERLLVLKNGRIAAGRISQSATGYVVDRPNGSFLIPFELADFEAASLAEAHRRLRQRNEPPSATAHVSLARWCMTHDLFPEARQELRAALELEPNRLEARRMLVRLEEILNADPAGPPERRDRGAGTPRPRDGFQTPEVRSLAGLSREAASEFVARVQPLLVNKCGNAACHGGQTENGFRLAHVRIAQQGNRVVAEQNLAATLAYVDFEAPDQSPLLIEPEGSHGRGGRAVFHGPRGAEQQRILREWIRKVVADEAPDSPRPLNAAADAVPVPAPADVDDPPDLVFEGRRAAETAGGRGLGRSDARAGNADSENPGLRSAPAPATPPLDRVPNDDLLDAVLREEQRDAFDPDVFNRAVHGRKR